MDHFIPAPGKRTPLYCDLSELHPQKKSQSKLVGPLYTRSRAENASIKWPVRVTPLKKHQPMLVARTTLYPLPSRERLYKVACLGYTPAKNQTDVGWTTLYPLPSRERLYKVACPGYTPEKHQPMLVGPLYALPALSIPWQFKAVLPAEIPDPAGCGTFLPLGSARLFSVGRHLGTRFWARSPRDTLATEMLQVSISWIK